MARAGGEIRHARARGLDHPARGRGGLVVGSGRTGGGCTETSNSIGESEGLLAVSFFSFLSTKYFRWTRRGGRGAASREGIR